mmetsp:Transcript_23655/g.42821  ORF Transcript_23655/g.42821 Transcript_23655/m.42821 type:complete len:187 (+) Transcript_23655:85-645(+)|eukprot:CAMPEP_0197655174 /NCGR_PEP_ID=MMETSP1338-20131121/39295_1 /TAXON_ID=43686 ORGANISM="Pelagodinium beii, Strain RCC1491" /NCGR_SAMPLE_ID=MMETSP1338 /ASSEMBLY_ACC=CAM_ASM_000754 /LENGTH=186 /DNA_ID=CAMNT_0043230771 /DNA_START=76 /DNA_END=636 /DNA_ORIENTATION=+
MGYASSATLGALISSLLPCFFWHIPVGRSAWCWKADGKDPAGPTGGVVLNKDTFITNPKSPYYANHMSPCCTDVFDNVPSYYCFNEMECSCKGEGEILCDVMMPHDDVLSKVPGRSVSCPSAQWKASQIANLTSASSLEAVHETHMATASIALLLGLVASSSLLLARRALASQEEVPTSDQYLLIE